MPRGRSASSVMPSTSSGGCSQPDLREHLARSRRRAGRRCSGRRRRTPARAAVRARASCALDGARRRAVGREDARREREVGQIVVELRLEGLLGLGDAVVHLVDQLPVKQPREHRQRREHDHGRQRDQRGELGADGRAGEAASATVIVSEGEVPLATWISWSAARRVVLPDGVRAGKRARARRRHRAGRRVRTPCPTGVPLEDAGDLRAPAGPRRHPRPRQRARAAPSGRASRRRRARPRPRAA